jgi:pyruvate ferredoxin oxidoreductase delta subunit
MLPSAASLYRLFPDVFLVVNEVNVEPESIDDMPKTSYSKPSIGSMGKTGSWRTFNPVINYEECNKCRTCWLYCPEAVIDIDDEDFPRIDLEYCKGCGICAQVCPKECIEMVRTVTIAREEAEK